MTEPTQSAAPLREDDRTVRPYQLYFASGHYDRRYPTPNVTVWHRIRAVLPKNGHVIDFGCGSGRYLLRLRGLAGRAAGFDINPAALTILRARANEMGWTDLAVLGPEPAALDAHVAQAGRADLVLCLFGVIGHILPASARHASLRQMHGLLDPAQGRLMISVPNRRRRFATEQRAAGARADGRIEYTRDMDGVAVTLPYQLYTPDSLQDELAAAGFRTLRIRAESVFPESWLLRNAALRLLDRGLTLLCPARWGYGILAEAAP